MEFKRQLFPAQRKRPPRLATKARPMLFSAVKRILLQNIRAIARSQNLDADQVVQTKLGAIRAFAGLDLGELGDELPGAAVEVGHDGLTLGVEAEA
jgi:hypothetical protein